MLKSSADSGSDLRKELSHQNNQKLEDELQGIQEKQSRLIIRNAQLEGVLRIIPDAVIYINNSEIIEEVNPGFTRIFGYEAEEVIGKKSDLLYRDEADYQELEKHFRSQSLMEQNFNEIQFKRKDSTIFPGGAVIYPANQEAQNIAGQILYIRDITEQCKKKNELEFQALLLDKIRDRITATDLEGNITYVNEAECVSFKKKREEMIGQNVRIYGEDAQRGATQEEIITNTLKNGYWRGKVVNITESREEMLYDSRIQLFYDHTGKAVGMVGISTDITEMQRTLDEFRESEELFRTIFDQSAAGIAQVSPKEEYLRVNKRFCEITGYREEELLSMNFRDISHLDDFENEQIMIDCVIQNKADNFTTEKRIWHKDGRLIWINMAVNIMKNKEGVIKFGLISIIDVTERRKIAERLLDLSTRLTLAVESAEIGIWDYEVRNKILHWDERMYSLCGRRWSDESNAYNAWQCSLHPKDLQRVNREINEAIEGKSDFDTDFRVIWEDGSVHFLRAFAIVQHEKDSARRLIGINFDITKSRCSEQKLKSALAEKSTLLRELYHRTKNNMQVICSMLDLEAMNNDSEYVRRTFQEMGNRIQTMSMVHNKLYQSENLSQIDLSEYIGELSQLMIKGNLRGETEINIRTELEPIKILMDIAIPCGLILNELISNSLKYAFSGRTTGEIFIKLSKAENIVYLTYTDNGVGLPEDFEFEQDRKLGLLLVQKLISSQLKGQMRYNNENGLAYQIRFSEDYYNERT